MFNASFVARYPARFITTDWVDIPGLQDFLKRHTDTSTHESPFGAEAASHTYHVESTRVKAEPNASPVRIPTIKEEPDASDNLPLSGATIRTRTFMENGNETIEILSDTEGEEEGDDMWLTHPSSDMVVGSSFGLDSEEEDLDDMSEDGFSNRSSSDWEMDVEGSDSETELKPSPTQWLDAEIDSHVSGPRRLHRQLHVDHVEFLSEIPTYWPVPRVKTAYILDLSDPKFNITDDNGRLLSVDNLIRDKVSFLLYWAFSRLTRTVQDQDSWTGGTGNGHRESTAQFDIFTGEGIPCRRVRLKCAGFHACANVDPKLLQCKRFELDLGMLKDVVETQVQA